MKEDERKNKKIKKRQGKRQNLKEKQKAKNLKRRKS